MPKADPAGIGYIQSEIGRSRFDALFTIVKQNKYLQRFSTLIKRNAFYAVGSVVRRVVHRSNEVSGTKI